MRIGLICPVFRPTGGSGIGNAYLHRALGLSALGHTVDVFTWLDPSATPVYEKHGIRVHRVPNPSVVNIIERAANKMARSGYRRLSRDSRGDAYATARDVRGALTTMAMSLGRELGRMDLLEACEWGGACGAFARRSQSQLAVCGIHGSVYSHRHRFARHTRLAPIDVALASAIERAGANRADVAVAPTSEAADDARDWLGIRRPVHVVPNCIDLPWVDSLEPVQSRGEASEEISVVFSGHVAGHKGSFALDWLVGQLRSEPSDRRWRVRVLGYLKDVALYRHLSTPRAGGVTVETTGVLPPSDVLRELKGADIFLCLSEAETFGMGVLEAMACGAAVISTPVGAAADMIDDGGTGLLVPVGDGVALHRAIDTLAEADLRRRIRHAARTLVEHRFNSAHVAAEWLRVCLA